MAAKVVPLCGCDQETLLTDPNMRKEYGDGLGVTSTCLVCKSMDPNQQIMVGSHPRKVSAAEHAAIAKAMGVQDMMAQATSTAQAKAMQANLEHEHAVATMQLIASVLKAKFGETANGMLLHVKSWDPTFMVKLHRAQQLVANDEMAKMLSSNNSIKSALSKQPIPWNSEAMAFWLATVGGDRSSADKGAVEIPEPVVGMDASRRGVVQSYLKSVIDAFKKVTTSRIDDWPAALNQYAMLLKYVAGTAADDEKSVLAENLVLTQAADKFHLIAGNMIYLIDLFAPILTKAQAHTLCSNLFGELVGQTISQLNHMTAFMALNVTLDGSLFRTFADSAQKLRTLAWDEEPKSSKRVLATDAAKPAAKTPKVPVAAKAAPAVTKVRAMRDLASGEAKPHADSKALALAAGRFGPLAPYFCSEFRDGNCSKGDACNSFHLCWYCWSKLQKPYEECMHSYAECAHKDHFAQVAPPKWKK